MASTLQSLSRRVSKHITDDEKLHRETNTALTKLAGEVSDATKALKGFTDGITGARKLFLQIATIIASAVVAGYVGVLTQNFILHQETAKVTQQEAAKVAKSTTAAASNATSAQYQKIEADLAALRNGQ